MLLGYGREREAAEWLYTIIGGHIVKSSMK